MSKLSPMMAQYMQIKAQNPDCLLLFRLGDFYELFFDDALLASKELDIALTGRDCGQEERAPMCGVPYHAVDTYVAKLIEKGYRVAICEQMEDPKAAKGIVKREVVRILTPGTVTETGMLDSGRNNYIACIYEDGNGYGLSYADVSTGAFYVTCFDKHDGRKVTDELGKLYPKEFIVNDAFADRDMIRAVFGVKPSVYNAWVFEYQNAYVKLCNHFGVLNLNGLGLEGSHHGVCACGALLYYLFETQKNTLNHILTVKVYQDTQYMGIDLSSRRNLELTENVRDRSKKGSLLWVLDHTETAMGARLLRSWLEQPLTKQADIKRRLDAVDDIKSDAFSRAELKELLHTIYDFERIISKIIYNTANGRDLNCLKKSFAYLPDIREILRRFQSPLLSEVTETFDDMADLYGLIAESICNDPPVSVREGGVIRGGVNAELDKLREAKSQGHGWLKDMEAAEREETGIKTLKIRYNKVFGYYIEVSNGQKHLAPARYVRRQTLANGERFTTTALKEIEDTILGADERIAELEYRLFTDIIRHLASEVTRMQFMAAQVATVDVLVSLADVAEKNNYAKPDLNDTGEIIIHDGRHPVVERMLDESFVPNDTVLDCGPNRLSIITGPNMAGKSTYMRQTALITLMAQIGSFVPASVASISIVDRIFTRVGAADDLATGQSTFMLEMSEVANILNSATPKSLIILDEIGRGTSTFDGLSIAWSVLEYIAAKIGAKTLFATHYHELTELEGRVDGVNNYCVLVQERGRDIVFLRKIIKGQSDSSYGIHVAKLAGVPGVVLERASDILYQLNQADITQKPAADIKQGDGVVYYGKKSGQTASQSKIILSEILSMDLDALTPKQAIQALYDLQSKTLKCKEELEIE